jgi:diguanylate cyclase (GGDEF)-like protein/PAS domain S-box-containing protein
VEHQGTAADGRALQGIALCFALFGIVPAHGADRAVSPAFSFPTFLLVIAAAGVMLVLYGLVVHRLLVRLRASEAKAARASALTSAREALLQEKEWLSVILQSIGEAVIVTDANGNVQYLNPAAEKMLGWNAAGATGMPLSALFRICVDGVADAVDPVAQCVDQGGVVLASGTLKRLDGKEFSVEHSSGPIRDSDGGIRGVVLSLRDVTEMRHLARQLSYQASHDALTGLINRREFELRLDNALRSAKDTGKRHVLCYLDLDQFKAVNDTCGHIAGDQLLKQITSLIKSLIRDSDTLARLGGDEFGILLEGCSVANASQLAGEIHKVVNEFRFVWDERSFRIGVSVGIAELNADSGGVTEILSAADAACYFAKDLGRNRTHVHRADEAMRKKQSGGLLWAERLSAAMREQRLLLHAQPVVSLQDNDMTHRYEVLVRMVDEDGHLIPPQAFIPAAERYNLMASVDRWVVAEALRRWRELPVDWTDSRSRCLINLSAHSLSDPTFLEFLTQELRHSGIAPAHLAFEVSENTAVAHMSQTREFVLGLRNIGCRFGLDDFGVGLSSFAYLKNLAVDYVKIDGNFVRDLTNDPIDHAVVESINQLGHVMGIETIAEYVESEAVLKSLIAMGVDYAQGHAIGQPLPLAEGLLRQQAHGALNPMRVLPSGVAEGLLQQMNTSALNTFKGR